MMQIDDDEQQREIEFLRKYRSSKLVDPLTNYDDSQLLYKDPKT